MQGPYTNCYPYPSGLFHRQSSQCQWSKPEGYRYNRPKRHGICIDPLIGPTINQNRKWCRLCRHWCHYYNDVIMGTMASQITSRMTVYSSIYSGANQRKHQSFASLIFVMGIHRWPVNSPHKGPVTQKMIPFDDVIMVFSGHVKLQYIPSIYTRFCCALLVLVMPSVLIASISFIYPYSSGWQWYNPSLMPVK